MTAAKRRTTELATLKRKLQKRFFDRRACPGRPIDQFIAELDLLLQKLHDIPVPLRRKHHNLNNSKDQLLHLEFFNELVIPSQSLNVQRRKTKNYSRSVKRLKHKFRLNNIVLQKTDKLKVFHLGRLDDYRKKSQEYMEKTQAYRCLGNVNPLSDLIQQTNKQIFTGPKISQVDHSKTIRIIMCQFK